MREVRNLINGNGSLAGLAPSRSPGMNNGPDLIDGSEYVPNVNYEPALPSLVRRGAVDPQLLRSLGDTPAGQLWALKAAHPNGEEVTASAGIPDHTAVPVVTPEFRSSITITGDSLQTGNDDVDIVMLSCSELAFMYRRYTSGTVQKPEAGWVFVFYPALEVQNNSFTATGLTSGEKETVQYWTTSLNDYGRTRAMYNGITVHLDAPTLADQGRLVAAQLPLEMREGTYQSGFAAKLAQDDIGETTALSSPIQAYTLPQGFPYTESSLFQATPGAVVWEAREGVYIPLRFREPVHLFEADRIETLFSVVREDKTTAAIQGTVFGNVPDAETRNLTVGVPNNMLSSIILIRGIDKRANLQVKSRIGLESLVEGPTQVAPFQHASPILDKRAIDQVTRLSQASPQAYPACYNDFSAILNTIKGVISGFVKPIAGALGDLGIPIISDVAGGINGIIGQLGLSSRRHGRRSLNAAMRNMRM